MRIWSSTPCSLITQATQIFASGGGVHQWRGSFRPTLEDILFDHHPALKMNRLKMLQDRLEVNHALSQRRKDPVPDPVVEVQFAGAGFLQLGAIDVLQVQAAQAVAMTFRQFHWISAAIKVMPGIEAKSEGAIL